MSPDVPTLTDGDVTLRGWREDDYEAAAAGHDQEIGYWNHQEGPPTAADYRSLVEEWRRARRAGVPVAPFVIEHEGRPAGSVELTPGTESGVGRVSWALWAGERGRGLAARATRLVTDWALTPHDDGGAGLGAPRQDGAVAVAPVHEDAGSSKALG